MIYPFKTKRQLRNELQNVQRLNLIYAKVLKIKIETNRFLVKQFTKLNQKYRLAYAHTYTSFIAYREQSLILDQVSPSFARLFGYDVEELEGMRLRDIFPAEQYRELSGSLEGLPQTGEIVLRSACFHKDGRQLPILTTIKVVENAPPDERYYLLNVFNLSSLNEPLFQPVDRVSV